MRPYTKNVILPWTLTAILVLIALLLLAAPLRAQTPAALTPADFTFEGFYHVATNGNNSTYSQGLTHRYVNGQQRFLTVSPQAGAIDEFTIDGKLFSGTVLTARTARWTVPSGTLAGHNGIWWEEGKNRLWVTNAVDYNASVRPSQIILLSLPPGGGAATLIWKGSIAGVNDKRMYGGCRAVPAWAQAEVGGPYECGSGGYTSLLAQGGGASLGPTMFAIDEPTNFASGSSIPLRKRVLDIVDSQANRGVRTTIPQNYFDGGDTRANPPTRPTAAVATSGKFLSPMADGLGQFVWGDSYYNTGLWIDTPTSRGFVLIASLCKGFCWYQSSTLAFDSRQFEWHVWAPGSLGSNMRQRPTAMKEVVLPNRGTAYHKGNSAVENVGGATFDAVAGRAYLWTCGGDPTIFKLSCGLMVFKHAGGGAVPPPVDTDGDGVADSVDACPTVAGTMPNGCPPAPVVDTEAPVVSITAPLSGADVSGDVTVSATASDNVGVQSVQFSVDGVDFGVADTSVTYARVWSAGATPGTHILRAVARDAAGNTTTSAAVTVTVGGGAPPPPPPPPVDSDGDGVPDNIDACPSVAANTPDGCQVVVPPPPPPPSRSARVSLTVTQCELRVDEITPPDATGGWKVQFKRNASNHGRADTDPYTTKTAKVGVGAYLMTAIWTKGETTITQDLGTLRCEGAN